jgi:hypothetical protein
MSLAAPSFNSSGVLMGDKVSLMGKYLGKAGYSGLTGAISVGSGTFIGDLMDNGKIDISGSQYKKSMTQAGFISGGLSLAASSYKYATWDRYSLDGKLNILKTKLNLNNLELDVFSRGYGYTKGGNIYITPLGLENRSIAKLTIFHEQYHISDLSRPYPAGSIPKDPEKIRNILETRAHFEELKVAPNYNITSRFWNNSRLLLRNTYNYSGPIPNTLGVHHTINNLFY